MSLDAHVRVGVGALDVDLHLLVAAGQRVALLGPNGAGKTTVLRCLAGLVPLATGRISMDDRVLDDPATDTFVDPRDRSVGLVFQDYVLFEHMTVLENVAFGQRARGVDARSARTEARGWLHRLGLDDYASRRPRALSGGQAQRVALARALAPHPRLLLLDEPLAALDASTRSVVRRDLRQHLSSFEGMTVVVTHDPVDAYALADRVAILDGGRIVQSGTFAEVTAHPRSRYVAELVGVNLIRGRVSDGVLQTTDGARVVVADATPGESYALIRPSSIVLDRRPSDGSSVRNTWRGVVTELDRLGDRVRVGVHGPLPLVAEITVSGSESLGLRSGDEVFASVKATDIETYPA